MELKNTYNKEELLSMANGDMFGQENAKLPLEPMLMIDRILNIKNTGGYYDWIMILPINISVATNVFLQE